MLYNIKLLLRSKNDKSLPDFMVHKHQSQNDDYDLNAFCQSKAVVTIFGSHVKYLVVNLILHNSVLLLFPME